MPTLTPKQHHPRMPAPRPRLRLLLAAFFSLIAVVNLPAPALLLAQASRPAGPTSRQPPAAGRPGTAASRPAADAAAGAPAAADKASTPTADGPGLLQTLRGFIRQNYLWILGVLGVFFLALLAWALLGGRRGAKGESAFAELGLGGKLEGAPEMSKRYSSTKIEAAEVNDRVAGGVKTSEVETDREYALVVDEEALKMPPLPEEIDTHTGRQFAEASALRKLVEEKKFGEAYEEYLRRIESDASVEFQGQLEQSLSEHFLRERDFAKAARILEHHVATHAATDVRAETYFNLGYIHFLNRTLNKSRRFLKLFVESEKNPKYVARATAILEKIEGGGRFN